MADVSDEPRVVGLPIAELVGTAVAEVAGADVAEVVGAAVAEVAGAAVAEVAGAAVAEVAGAAVAEVVDAVVAAVAAAVEAVMTFAAVFAPNCNAWQFEMDTVAVDPVATVIVEIPFTLDIRYGPTPFPPRISPVLHVNTIPPLVATA